MPGQGPRIILIGGTYRALCVLERLIERGERVVGFIGQEGTQERDFCPEILEVCDRHSIPARSAHKFGEEIVRWLEDRIRPELVLAIGLETQVPLAIGGNSRLGLVEVLDSFESRGDTRVMLRQKGQTLIDRASKASDEEPDAGDAYLEMIDTALEVLDEYLDGVPASGAPAPRRVRFHPERENSDPGAGHAGAEPRRELERRVASYLDADRVLALDSLADAFAALVGALRLGEGDQVICPAYCSKVAVAALRACGAEPIFVDLEPSSLALDTGKLAAAITTATRAILVSHPFGRAAAIDRVYPLAEESGLEVIEDAGHSLGARFDSSRIGRSPCTAVFQVPVPGHASDAALLAGPQSLIEAIEALEPLEALEALEAEGEADRSPSITVLAPARAGATLGLVSGWDDELESRLQIGRAYNEQLSRYDAFRIPSGAPERPTTYAGYALSLTRFARTSADDLHRLLLEGGVESQRPVMPARERDLADLPVAESARHNTIVLPAHSELGEDDLQLVLDLLFDYAIG